MTAVPVAESSLRQILVDPKVAASTLRALEACRQLQQLHAAVKLVWRKLTPAVQTAARADVPEWSPMCAEAVPTAPTAPDRLQFLRTCHHNIGNAPQATDWITVALDLSTQLPNAIDPSPIVDVQCARTFRAALLTISKQEDLSRDHLRQASLVFPSSSAPSLVFQPPILRSQGHSRYLLVPRLFFWRGLPFCDKKKACIAGNETLKRVKIVVNNAYVTRF